MIIITWQHAAFCVPPQWWKGRIEGKDGNKFKRLNIVYRFFQVRGVLGQNEVDEEKPIGSIEKLWHVVILDQDVSYRLIYSWLEFALQELTAPVAINRFFI